MKVLSKITLAGLLALTAVVIVMNFHYLYTAPVANTDVWWRGDETWLMSQYKQFVTTGHYINPLSPGSAYSQCSGLFFGSCYLTAAFYGLPLLVIEGHTIDAGRTLTWILAMLTLPALWVITRRYRVSRVLCAYGCLLLSGTVCFFITSHSARSDMLVGLTIMIFTGCLPLIIEKSNVNRDLLLGLIIPLCLLINGHVLINSFPMLCYLIWVAGGLKSTRSILRWVTVAAGGFVCLLITQEALLGSASLLGPLGGGPGMMPIVQLLHPKSDIANFNGRILIANTWAPGLLWVFVVLMAAILWARIGTTVPIRYKIRLSQMEPASRRLVISAGLVVLSSLFLEFYQTRYFIYVLPTIVLAFLIVISHLVRILPRAQVIALSVALSACLAFALWRYEVDTLQLGATGEIITAANKTAVTNALATIHSRRAGMNDHFRRLHIFSTTPGQYIAMDDSCELVTPVIYTQPSEIAISHSDLWKHAKIDYAIICNSAHGYDWIESDLSIDSAALSHARIIFRRIGLFSDIGRAYDPADLKNLDTLVVYEF